jgi:hypothetical protein
MSGESDLFQPASGVPAGQQEAPGMESPPKPLSRTPIVLPSNLPLALQSLDEASFNTLLRDVAAEAHRRRSPSAAVAAEIAGHNAIAKAVRSPPTPSKVDAATVATGKANLIRAAFKAGVKPTAIAREFGISQSVVRGVLASLKDRH